MNNHAFIDAQNLYKGVSGYGWQLDYRRFRGWLTNRFGVSRAYMFFGYIKENDGLYGHLERCGFILEFREIQEEKNYIKGNIDIDLTMAVMDGIYESAFDQAYLITSDGDFFTLVKRLNTLGKLGGVISPHQDTCSRFLKKATEGKITYLEAVRKKMSK